MEKNFEFTLTNKRTYAVTFYSPYAFRLYEVGGGSGIALHPEALGLSAPKITKAKDSVTYSLGGSKLILHKTGVVEFYRQSRLLSSFRLLSTYVPQAEVEDLSGKEGHHPSGGDHGYQGGLVIRNDSPVYGLGDKTGPLDKRGYRYINYNTDNPNAHVDTFKSLYKSINFFTLFHKFNSLGFFLDNSSRTYYDFNQKDPSAVEVSYAAGKLDLYVFVGSLLKVASYFALLSGTNPLPPRFALGYQQSRWSYGSEAEVDAVIAGYQAIGCPLSVIHLDIAYMDHYKDFTVDASRFPDIAAWADKLLGQGVHLVSIIDAGVKAEKGYSLYDEGIKAHHFSTLNGEVYHNEVWPGDSVFPSFMSPLTQDWWSQHVAEFLKSTHISGIWNDMNEPASFKGPLPEDVEMGGLPHSLAHNLYGHYMSKATYEGFIALHKRPFIITRSAFAGTSAYATTWTGDNQSLWDHLRLTIPQQCNLSLSGYQMIGNDIGGFGGDTTKELLLRWIALGVANPLMRNHSAYMTKDQEGYRFDGETSKIYAAMVRLRYELIPYLYDLLREAEVKGTPIYRALVLNYPDDSYTYNENSEFMLGDALLFAPALLPGEHHRYVYFPDDFYDFETGKLYTKGHYLIDTPLDKLPLFVKKNSLLALAPKGTMTPEFTATLVIYATSGSMSYRHYEDAGDGLGYKQGEYNLFLISKKGKKIALSYLHQGLKTHYEKVVVLSPNGHKKTYALKDLLK